MGLFDGYDFGPRGYSDGGGMIDRLIAGLQMQGQYAPSDGFGGASPSAQAQTAPIAVGDYQMPRVGDADLFQPQQAMTPPNAQPAQGQLPRQTAEERANGVLPGQAPAQPLPSFLQSPGNGIGDRLEAGFKSFSGNLHTGLVGSILSGANGLMTGQRNDPGGLAQEALRAQYQSLIPILGEQRARLAVLNPEIGKAMVAQALSGKNYTFATLPDGTVLRQDAHAGTAQPVYQGGLKPTFGVIDETDGRKTYGWIDPSRRTTTPIAGAIEPPSNTVTGPDGKPIPIPPGVDRKTFVNEISKINADAAGGKKTEVQAKDEKFANKMELAEKNLKGLDNQYTGFAGGALRGTEYIPGVGNAMQTEGYQKYRQARDNFITALLRDESGAAIGTQEFSRYEKELFPQPGDGPAVVKQKREARRVAIEGMKKGAGPGYKSPNFDSADGDKADPLGIR